MANDFAPALIIPLSDDRTVEIWRAPYGDEYSVRINLRGKKQSLKSSFILSRLDIEKILSLTKDPGK